MWCNDLTDTVTHLITKSSKSPKYAVCGALPFGWGHLLIRTQYILHHKLECDRTTTLVFVQTESGLPSRTPLELWDVLDERSGDKLCSTSLTRACHHKVLSSPEPTEKQPRALSWCGGRRRRLELLVAWRPERRGLPASVCFEACAWGSVSSVLRPKPA